MDLLKKELERKKKALEGVTAGAADDKLSSGSSGDVGRRFFRAGDLRRMQEEQEEAMKVEEQKSKKRRKRKRQNLQFDGREELKSPYINKRKGGEREQEQQEGFEEHGKIENAPKLKQEGSSSVEETDSNEQSHNITGKRHSSLDLLKTLQQWSPEQVTRKLREMGLPVRIFGERTIKGKDSRSYSDASRLERLKTALQSQKETLDSLDEMEEFRLGRGHGIRNPFLEKEDEESPRVAVAAAAAAVGATSLPSREETTSAAAAGGERDNAQDCEEGKRGNSEQGADENQDDDDVDDPHKKIYKYFKGLLKEWEEDLYQRPDHIKRTVAGKNDTKTLKQCKDYIRPLFKLCKSRKLEPGLTANLVKMVDHCQAGHFVDAHSVYMDVAIGRAAWPIGVTMVGIHARSGRAKIESQNVAHVMNSELQRKYLTSVKRLITYAQSKRTDIDPSRKVMN